jgi:hypothetical protein
MISFKTNYFFTLKLIYMFGFFGTTYSTILPNARKFQSPDAGVVVQLVALIPGFMFATASGAVWPAYWYYCLKYPSKK